MRWILFYSNFIVAILYMSVGIFGYVSFADVPEVFDSIGGVLLIASRYKNEIAITIVKNKNYILELI
jgi:hypothetical protein